MKKFLSVLGMLVALVCSSIALFACTPIENSSEKENGGEQEYLVLSVSELSLIVGDEYALVANYYVDSEDALTFTSSAPAVVKVGETGELQALSVGTATITATLGEFSANCEVEVGLGDYLPSLYLMGIEEDNVVISMTDTLDFGAKILFNGKYFDCETQFTVKDVTVGSVVDGAFVPAQEGTTEVVVKGVWNGIQTLPVTVSVSVINTVEISLKESGSGNEVEKISLCTYESFDGKEYQTQFLPVIEVVENGVKQTENIDVCLADDNGVVELDLSSYALKAVAAGKDSLQITYTSKSGVAYTKKFEIKVMQPVAVSDAVFVLDASKGELPVNEIFAEFDVADRKIVAADGLDGVSVQDGKVFGFTVDNEKSQTVNVYNKYVGYQITVIPYTRIFTTVEELAYFNIPDSNGQNEGADETKTFDGYYILGNDIDASWKTGYSHAPHARFEGFGPMQYEWGIGLTGTFDGKGHTIDGMWLNDGGFFGMIQGGTVKNVAFTDVHFEYGGSNTNTKATLATYIIGGSLENVYIQAPTLVEQTSGWHGLVANSITLGTSMRACIFQLDEKYPERSWGAYGSLMAQTVQKSVFESEDVSTWGNGCYVISPTVLSKNLIYENGSLSEKDVIDAGNIPNANEQFEAQGQTKTERRYTATGIKRYETANAMKADSVNNDYSAFNPAYWDLSSGMPVWKK